MPITYKVDVLAKLKEKGYTTYRLRNDKIFAERTIQAFRNGKMVSWESFMKLCQLLKCQPGDIIEYIEPAPDGAEQEENGNADT